MKVKIKTMKDVIGLYDLGLLPFEGYEKEDDYVPFSFEKQEEEETSAPLAVFADVMLVLTLGKFRRGLISVRTLQIFVNSWFPRKKRKKLTMNTECTWLAKKEKTLLS